MCVSIGQENIYVWHLKHAWIFVFSFSSPSPLPFIALPFCMQIVVFDEFVCRFHCSAEVMLN